MEIKKVPAGIAVAIIITAVVLFIVLSGGDDDSSSTTATTTTPDQAGQPAVIQIKDGEPVGGVQDLSFTEGDDIRFKVKSDRRGRSTSTAMTSPRTSRPAAR